MTSAAAEALPDIWSSIELTCSSTLLSHAFKAPSILLGSRTPPLEMEEDSIILDLLDA